MRHRLRRIQQRTGRSLSRPRDIAELCLAFEVQRRLIQPRPATGRRCHGIIEPMPGIHHAAICTADVERSMRFWRDGLGLTEFFDRTFVGDWPELFGAKSDRLQSIFLGDPQTPDSGLVELVVFEGPTRRSGPTEATAARIFPALAAARRRTDAFRPGGIGFHRGCSSHHRCRPGRKTVPMAVITAPDGVLVELIGPRA